MTYKKLRRLSFLFCLFSALIFPSLRSEATLTGKWIQHHGVTFNFDRRQSMAYRIIDGNRFVYFLMCGANYYHNNGVLFTSLYNTVPYQLVRYDKTAPWESVNVVSAANDFELGGGYVDIAEYNPRESVLVVVYDNRDIDIIFDDGRIVKSNALKNIQLPTPATNQPYSVTFDLERPECYIATAFGYLRLNILDGEALEYALLGKYVSWAARVGDKMVVIAGDDKFEYQTYKTTTYVFDCDNVPASLDGFELAVNNNPSNLNLADMQALMPLSDTSFAVIAYNTSATNYKLARIDLAPGGNTATQLANTTGTFDSASAWNYARLFRTDGRYCVTNDGFMVADGTYIFLIKSDGSVTTLTRPAAALTNEKTVKTASIDGKTFWHYTYFDRPTSGEPQEQGFYTRSFENGAWTDKSDIVYPNVPYSSVAYFCDWAPEYGMIFRSPGCAHKFSSEDVDAIFTYKDGIWTDVSYQYRNPKYTVMTDRGKGLAIDPLNHNWIWSTGMIKGLIRRDIGDFNNFLAYGIDSQEDYVTLYPGFFNVLPNQNSMWNNSCNFSLMSFDNKGTMWFARDWLTSYDDDHEFQYYTTAYLPLYYLTADERLSMANIGTDKSKLVMPHEIRVPHTMGARESQTLALRHPDNENFVAFTVIDYKSLYRDPFIYDHNGTLEDTSDDRCFRIQDIADAKGEPLNWGFNYLLYEEPHTGDLWLATDRDLYIINPREAFNGSRKAARLHIERKFGADVDEYPFEQIIIRGIKEDNIGRKWIASENGLYVLSADNKEMLAHFTTDNSPLFSNVLISVGCDLATGAVFACTTHGIVEFRPENYEGASFASVSDLNLWPLNVNPHYNGYLNLSGTEAGKEYVVENASGRTVATLGRASSASMQWDCRDNEGNLLSSGRYYIRETSSTRRYPFTILK